MPTSRPFCYNPSPNPLIPETEQVGSIAAATGVPVINATLQWWNGPDEDLGYVIAYVDPSGDRPNAPERTFSTNYVCNIGFFRSAAKTEESFAELTRTISGSSSILNGTQSKTWLNNNGYWTSYSTVSTLGTIGNPAVSAQAIYNSGQTTSGWYYIQTSNMTSAKQIYCNMTDEGGGWMLMSYSPNNTSAPVGIPYPNQWLGGTGSLTSRVSIDARQVWYHNGLAQCSQVMKMASTTASLVPLVSNVAIANKVVYSNPNNLRLSATFSTTLNNNTPMTGTWSGIKGHTLMNTSLAVNAPGDWIYSVNTWWTVCGPSTQLSVDGRSGNAQGSGSWTNISSNTIYGMADVNTITNSVRSDIKTYAVYIK